MASPMGKAMVHQSCDAPNQSLRASQDHSKSETCGTTTGRGDQVHGGEYGDRTSQGGGGARVAESNA